MATDVETPSYYSDLLKELDYTEEYVLSGHKVYRASEVAMRTCRACRGQGTPNVYDPDAICTACHGEGEVPA